MDSSTQGLPVLHHLPKSAQVHVHCIGDPAILSSSPPSRPALSLSQHQGLFQRVSSLHRVAKALKVHTRRPSYWSFSFTISPSNEYAEFDFP